MVLRRVMIAGGRGGCGKSTVAAGLACALAQRGVRTAVLDFDLSERSLDMYLGCESRTVYDLSDLLSGERVSVALLHTSPPSIVSPARKRSSASGERGASAEKTYSFST